MRPFNANYPFVLTNSFIILPSKKGSFWIRFMFHHLSSQTMVGKKIFPFSCSISIFCHFRFVLEFNFTCSAFMIRCMKLNSAERKILFNDIYLFIFLNKYRFSIIIRLCYYGFNYSVTSKSLKFEFVYYY